MWTGVLLDDLLVAEDSGSAETTSALSHPTAANQSLARASPGAKLQEGNKQAQSEVTTPDRAVVMTDPIAVHANGDSNMDVSTEYARSYGHGYVLLMLSIS
jgi:hypothetical protein